MFCPNVEQLTTQILHSMPRGRAWQTNEGLPSRGWSIAFNPDFFNNEYFLTDSREGSVLWGYWRAFAEVMDHLHERACALRQEFWCASIVETRDEWMTEYGLPDDCDPFPDLCTKVAAIGGTRCEYYQDVAARAGWEIDCDVLDADCGARTGNALAGRASPGGQIGGATIVINVYVDESTAYQGVKITRPFAGRLQAGKQLSCEPNILPLICVLDRVVHAHIFILYKIIGG